MPMQRRLLQWAYSVHTANFDINIQEKGKYSCCFLLSFTFQFHSSDAISHSRHKHYLLYHLSRDHLPSTQPCSRWTSDPFTDKTESSSSSSEWLNPLLLCGWRTHCGVFWPKKKLKLKVFDSSVLEGVNPWWRWLSTKVESRFSKKTRLQKERKQSQRLRVAFYLWLFITFLQHG